MNRKRLCKKLAASLALSVTMVSMVPSVNAYAYGGEVDVSQSTFKTDTDNSSAFQTWRSTIWDTKEKADSGKIALTPDKDEKGVRFSWYSEQTPGFPAVRIWKKTDSKDVPVDARIAVGKATAIQQENWQGKVYQASNHVAVEDYLEENTAYQYQYTDNYIGTNTEWSEPQNYTTHSFASFTTILTGDPQIGASGTSTDNTDSDDSAARDAYNWNLTMESALKKAPNAAFLLSAGDQVDTSGASSANNRKARESEYAGYLYPSIFRSLPIASTIGNHDLAGIDYSYHFNNPNVSGLGATAAGSDYYFSYGDTLFISLNSNNRNQAEHRKLMQEAVASHEDAIWKVVIFHSDIYGSGQPHADTDASSNRIIFAPLMDEFDIDLCLTGHDHTYSRSYQIYNGEVIDYDLSKGSVLNPEGTLYITTGSGSGSKYYNLLNYTPYYIAERTNVCLPAYSTIDFTATSLTIKTYDYQGNQYADSFTIQKSAEDVTLAKLAAQVKAIEEDKYTEESVAAVQDAFAKLQNLYVIDEDLGAEIASLNYGTDSDPLSGYGSVKSNYQDKETTPGSSVNRLMRGFSSLLDKTIYLQLDGKELPIISGEIYMSAKQDVVNALSELKLVEEPGEEPSENPSEEPSENPSEESSENPSKEPSENPGEEPSQDIDNQQTQNMETTTLQSASAGNAPKTGDSNNAVPMILLLLAAAGGCSAAVLRKKGMDC